jgi:rubrerythrin
MNTREFADQLGSLMLLDFDAAHAYEEAIENLKPADLREQFTRFRIDHQDQVYALSTLIKQMGEEPPPHSNDFQHYSSGGIASPKDLCETREIVDLMYRNEKQIGERYADLKGTELPTQVASAIQQGFVSQERHAAYMESLLSLSPLGS